MLHGKNISMLMTKVTGASRKFHLDDNQGKMDGQNVMT